MRAILDAPDPTIGWGSRNQAMLYLGFTMGGMRSSSSPMAA
jgi:hypothetical protein